MSAAHLHLQPPNDGLPHAREDKFILGTEVAQLDYLKLPGLRTTKVNDEEDEFTIWVTAEQFPKLEECPVCGCDDEQFKRNGTRPQVVRHVPHGLQSVYIEVQRQSYYCYLCRKPFQHPLSVISSQWRMTDSLVKYVQKLSLIRPTREVALFTGASTKTIREIMTEHRQYLDNTVRFDTPRVLGLDGVFARVKDDQGKSKKKECLIITDIEAGLCIDLRPGVTIKEVSDRLRALPDPKRVQIVVIDMSTALLAAIREALPHAVIVIDLFHIQAKINDGLDRVRMRLRRGAARKKGQPTMCKRELLRKRRSQLKPNELKELEMWFDLKPELRQAYDLVEECLMIWNSSSSKTAMKRYRRWLEHFPLNLRKDFEELLSAFKNWGEYIFNYFDHKFTNAFTESSNRLVKDIQRETRGCDFETLRGKVIYGTWIKKLIEEARCKEMQKKKRNPQATKRRPRARKAKVNEAEPALALAIQRELF